MNILIAGASGFIGRRLVEALLPTHTISVLGRKKSLLERTFANPIQKVTWEELPQLNATQFDAVINLCGYNISASRWSSKVKKQLINSRVQTTSALVDWAISYKAKPHFLCANAIGIYGVQTNGEKRILDEDSPINFEQPQDFLSEIGIRWHQALQPAIDYGMKVSITRFGVVLGKEDGILKKLSPSFTLGLGSIIGDGKQIISWIHINDLVNAISFLLNKGLTGVYNLSSPFPVSQGEFARTLANAMHRPLFFKLPSFIVRLLFGEMGEYLLLKGQRVQPTRLIKAGFVFQFAELKDALREEYK